MLGGSQPSSASHGPLAFGASITGTLKYIGETIAQYTGLGSQSPPHSQASQPAKTTDEIVVLPAAPLPEVIARHAASQTQHGLKVRDFAYQNPLPPVPACKCHKRLPVSSRSPQSPPVATGSRPARPLKRSRDDRLNFAFMAPELFKQAVNPNKDDSNESTRPLKRQKRLGREDTEPLLLSQSQPPSQSPGFSDVRPSARSQQSKPVWHNEIGRRNDVFGPIAGPSRMDREAMWKDREPERVPTPPFERSMDVPQWLRDMREIDVPDVEMEDVIPTPIVTPHITPHITPQGSEVFSEWNGFGSSTTTVHPSESAGTPQSSLFGLSARRSLGDISQFIHRQNPPLVFNTGPTNSTTPSDRTISMDSAANSKHMQDGPGVPQTPYQLRPRATTPSPRVPPGAPRKTTARKLCQQRSLSPTLSLSLARQHKKSAGKTTSKAAAKTRSTLSKQASDKSINMIKPTVRRSPRTKTAARSVLARGLVPSTSKLPKK
ncbi:hypothetical protein BC835DRAFT_44233 [Cytidiella melzeri]|nr:hypothetical protein BC835DRAFT_44233 [Cytidiella melzeri]